MSPTREDFGMMCATTCTGSESRIPDRKYTTHNSPERIVFSDIEGGGTEAHPPLNPSDQGPPLDAIIKGLGIAKIQVRSAIQFRVEGIGFRVQGIGDCQDPGQKRDSVRTLDPRNPEPKIWTEF